MRKAIVWILILPILAYRLFLSPWLGHSCRFQPSCSAYAIEALQTHGPVRGLWLTLRRLARCNPCGGCGYDPVPPAAARKQGA
ncbi:membrane protein insertion efficiency factor YidD [Rhodobacteraceae bacterium NNCM2]|nr:membrane protein insertion efficiency factor YidD [Coraliihabitans acroporae]